MQTLARLGYSVKLCSSSGGTLRSLKHSFLTATRPSAFGGELLCSLAYNALLPPTAALPLPRPRSRAKCSYNATFQPHPT